MSKACAYFYKDGVLDGVAPEIECDKVINHLREGVSVHFGFSPDAVDVPESRFKNLKEVGRHLFEIEKETGGTFCIRNVPIFKTHASQTRKYQADEAFLDRIVKNYHATKAATKDVFGSGQYSWLPKVHFGHTPSDPNIPEQKNAGFISGMFRVGNFLFADFSGLDKDSLNDLVSGKYPDRSPEVDVNRGRLLSVAFLGHRAPHFGMPQMRHDVMRKKYETLGIERHSFNTEDFSEVPMSKPVTADQLAKFQTCVQDAIKKFKDETQFEPESAQLEELIRNVIQETVQDKVNDSPAGQEGYDASEYLDLESKAHHEASGDKDNAEPKKEGDNVQNSIDDAIEVIRHAFDPANEQKSGEATKALGELQKVLHTFGDMLKTHQAAITSLNGENAKLKEEKVEIHLRSELEKIRRDGHLSVGDHEDIERHLGILRVLDDTKQKEYLDQLRRSPKNERVVKHTFKRGEVVESTPNPRDVVSVVKHAFQDRSVKAAAEQLGIDEKTAILAESYAAIQGWDD